MWDESITEDIVVFQSIMSVSDFAFYITVYCAL